MNKTGARTVSDTIPAPVFCHFRAKNPHYFWSFFASAKRDQKDRVTGFECVILETLPSICEKRGGTVNIQLLLLEHVKVILSQIFANVS